VGVGVSVDSGVGVGGRGVNVGDDVGVKVGVAGDGVSVGELVGMGVSVGTEVATTTMGWGVGALHAVIKIAAKSKITLAARLFARFSR
jgi:hypothetical protein